jgi:hypothetical protein
LLIGSLVGCAYSKTIDPLLVPSRNTIDKDTIFVKDTVFIKPVSKHIVSNLNDNTLMEELLKQNIPHPKIVLAQAKLETANYKSKLCRNHNNLFGLKKGNSYRKYSTYQECVKDYKRLISCRIKPNENYYDFLLRIRYAEDEQYIQKLKKII